MNDEKLIELYFNRDEDAIRETENEYGTILRQVIRNYLDNEADVDECLNDVYLALWERIPPNRPEHFKAYAVRLAKNLAISSFRSINRRRRSPDILVSLEEVGEIAGDGDPESELLLKEMKAAIEEFLMKLSVFDRKIMIRRYWFGDDPKELAGKCNMSARALNSRIHRLRKKLERYLKKKGL